MEDDLCSACITETNENEVSNFIEENKEQTENPLTEEPAEQTFSSQELIVERPFFTALYPLMDGIDVTLKLKRRNGRIVVSVLPEATGLVSPAMVQGTPGELDDGFIAAITNPVKQAAGLQLDLDNYKKSLDKARAEAKKSEDAKSAPATSTTNPAGQKKSKPQATKSKTVNKKPTNKKEVKSNEDLKTKTSMPDMFANV